MLQAKFLQQRQVLLHGDLHTGSLMVTEDTTYVIDAEFAFAGPIAFDVGKMVANLLIAFFAGAGLQTPEAPRTRQRQWLLQVCPPSQYALSAVSYGSRYTVVAAPI